MTLPLVVETINCTFYKNFPIIDALFKVESNSKLYINGTNFTENYSVSRGAIVLADFENS